MLKRKDDLYRPMEIDSREEVCTLYTGIAVIDDDNIENIIDAANYSDIGSVLRITAWAIRFCENLKQKSIGKESQFSATLTSAEIQKAKRLWIKANQVRKDDFNNKNVG